MDVFGKALTDYYINGETDILHLYNSYLEPEEMPLDIFFRTAEEMPVLEHKALELCYGRTLDVGAGVGSHALLLQDLNIDVTAIDICADAVKIMKQRGVKKAFAQNILTSTEKYDTLLFLMNGIGLTETLPKFRAFLGKAKELINEGGQLIFDSSDISYLCDKLDKPSQHYFGEISYCYEYQNVSGKWFNWLYIDKNTLTQESEAQGWKCEIIYEDDQDQYLARLTLIS